MENKKWDAFISHASEDKDSIVRELTTELQKFHLKVWYDEFSLNVGDSLSKSIDEGLIYSNLNSETSMNEIDWILRRLK